MQIDRSYHSEVLIHVVFEFKVPYKTLFRMICINTLNIQFHIIVYTVPELFKISIFHHYLQNICVLYIPSFINKYPVSG